MDKVKVSFNLNPDDVKVLKNIAAERGTSVTEVLRGAIALEQVAHDATRRGAHLLLRDGGETTRVLIR